MPVEHDADFQGAYFSVEVDGLSIGYFTACSGLSMEFDVIEQASQAKDGKTRVVHKIPGRPKYSEVVLKRGFTPGKEMHDWFKQVLDAKDKTPYKTGAIVVFSRIGAEEARFSLLNMWPSKLTVSDLNAGSDDAMVEELTMQHEFIDWV